MAITAAITLGSASLTALQQTQAALVVSNSGGADVFVTGIQPHATPSAFAGALSPCPFGGPVTPLVPAGGSTTFYFDVVAFSPLATNPPVSPATYDYDVGATVYTNDGAVTEATPDTLTVSTYIE